MYLETKRLFIRNFGFDDAGDLHEILGDETVMEYCEPAYDYEKTTQFLKTFCIERGNALAAVSRESGKVIGYILFSKMDPGVYEAGWFFNRNVWRHGYAYEACKAVMDHAFCTLGVQKIFAETVDAEKSVGLMKKLGMRCEGLQRKQTRNCHGELVDLHLYGITKEDWEKDRS